MRESRSLVIARNDEHRKSQLGYASQRLVRLICDTRRHGRPIEDVAGVNDDVYLTISCRLERAMIVSEKVVSAPPSICARPHREIESQMRIREQQNPKRWHSLDGAHSSERSGRFACGNMASVHCRPARAWRDTQSAR